MDPKTERHPPTAIEDALRMMEQDSPLMEIIDRIWVGCSFDMPLPFYCHGALPLAYRLYEKFKSAPAPDSVPHCMLLLGRIYNAKGEYLPACRFFLVARNTFKSEYGIIAMEFFREELRSDEGRRQIGMSKPEFEARYSGDTAEGLVKEYGPPAGAGG